MSGPSKKDWRAARVRMESDLIRVWTDQWKMGRGPGESTVSEFVRNKHRGKFDRFPSLPLWVVRDLAREEVNERCRRALAAHRDTVEKPSRQKAGEMV